jgi:uncharacterized protein (DUF58 family)
MATAVERPRLGRLCVPNGGGKNFRRLLMACAPYRSRYGDWPAEARMSAGMMQDLARLLDADQFETLAATLKLSTKDSGALSVGGARGKVIYDGGVSDSELESLPLTERWLGIELRGRQLEE